MFPVLAHVYRERIVEGFDVLSQISMAPIVPVKYVFSAVVISERSACQTTRVPIAIGDPPRTDNVADVGSVADKL